MARLKIVVRDTSPLNQMKWLQFRILENGFDTVIRLIKGSVS